MSPEEIAGLLARTPVFSALDTAALSDLANGCFTRTFRRGQTVFTRGDPGDSMFVVASGVVKILVPADDGSEHVLVTLRAPESFGEIALVDGGPRSASAQAGGTSTVVGLRRTTLLETMRTHSGATEAVLLYLGGLVRRLTDQTADLVFLDLPGRVAKLLAAWADERGRAVDDGVALDLEVSQSEMAAMVGGSRQSVNQVLRAFERRGWIVLRGSRLVMLDRDALYARGGS